jgi:phosphoribosyl 1,2-cyclic phosphodiesterase
MNNPVLDEFVVQFWGVRGSIPSPGPETVRYGGNTSCIEIRAGGKRFIFDAGTGLRNLGKGLMDQGPVEIHMCFTHYHWDHIQGLPFFLPVFRAGNEIHIYGQVPEEVRPMSLKEHFYERVLHFNSPVPVQTLEADLFFHELTCGDRFSVGDVQISTGPLNHPNGAMGYRVDWRDRAIVYCTDTEHFPDRLDENLVALAAGADILIYDAMYTDEEYHNPKSPKVGWGHSTWEEGAKLVEAAGVRRLAVFHHEPNHTDDRLDEIAETLKARSPGGFLAKELQIVSVFD